MLLALIYTEDGSLAGAAPACDQQPWGDRYWQEFHPRPVRLAPDAETAYVEIDDADLIARLLSFDFADPRQAAAAVDDYLFHRQPPVRPACECIALPRRPLPR